MKEYIASPIINTEYGADKNGAWHRRVPKRDKTISARQFRKLKKEARRLNAQVVQK